MKILRLFSKVDKKVKILLLKKTLCLKIQKTKVMYFAQAA